MPALLVADETDSLESTPQAIARERVPASPGPNLVERLVSHLSQILSTDLNLLLAILALNALAMPYADLVHDARLYATQVTNHVEAGKHAADLFLRFGSQDRYSIFSTFAVPLTRVLGLPFCFFCLYLVTNTCYYWGLLRLVRSLVSDRTVTIFALLFVAVTPIPFGSAGAFHANENFLTPRLMACALVLWGLEQMLAGRQKTALALMTVALLTHPLMAFGGFAIFAIWNLVGRLGWRRVLWLGAIGMVLGSAFLAYGPLAFRILGHLDDDWRRYIRSANPCNFPSEWSRVEWTRIFFGIGIMAMAACRLAHPPVRRLLCVCLVVVISAVAVSFAAGEWLPYALLLQGQAYRVLWIFQLLQIPLGFMLAAGWWKEASANGYGLALFLLSYFGLLAHDFDEMFPAAVTLGAFAAWQYASRYHTGTGRRTLTGGLALAVSAFMILNQAKLVSQAWGEVAHLTGPLEFARTAFLYVNPYCLLAGGILVLLGLGRLFGKRMGFPLAAGSIALVVQLGFWIPAQLPSESNLARTVRFVRGYIAAHGPEHRTATVYWPVCLVDPIWFGLQSDSYFNYFQLAGNLFIRETAVEGHRRAMLVKRFESANLRTNAALYAPAQLDHQSVLFDTDVQLAPPPAREDLLRLVMEPIDFIVIPYCFDGLFAASDGYWYLYDCAALRCSMKGKDLP